MEEKVKKEVDELDDFGDIEEDDLESDSEEEIKENDGSDDEDEEKPVKNIKLERKTLDKPNFVENARKKSALTKKSVFVTTHTLKVNSIVSKKTLLLRDL